MVLTNTGLKIWYKAETHYGAGSGSADYAKTDPAADDLTRFNVLGGTIKLKGKKFLRSRLTAPGLGLGLGKVITKGAEFPEVEISYYLQTAADPFKTTSVGGTQGTIGTSYYIAVDAPNPDGSGAVVRYVIFGAQLTSYAVDGKIDSDTPPMVTLKFSCFDVEIDTGTQQTDALPAGVINEWDDIVVTLDADPITELTAFTATITLEYTKPGSGRNSTFARFKPLLADKTFEYKVSFFSDAAALLSDTITEALNTFTCIWTEGTNTITVTECHVEEDDFLEYKGDGIDSVEYTLTVVSGESVYS